MKELISPFISYDFMLLGLLAALINSIGLSFSGTFLVNKKMSFVGDSFSHAVMPGFALAYYFFGLSFVPLVIGGILVSLLLSFIFMMSRTEGQSDDDSALAPLFVTFMSIGIFIISITKNKLDLFHILFGSILSTSFEILVLMSISSFVTVVFFVLFWEKIIFESTDNVYLSQRGVNTKLLNFMFYFVVFQSLVFTFINIGTLLAFGFLVLPTSISRLLSRNLKLQVVLSFMFSLVGIFVGLLISYHFPVPTGSSIIIVLGLMFILVFLFKYGGFMKYFLILIITCTSAQAKIPVVVSSFSILSSMIKDIAKDKVEIITIVGANQDAHEYQESVQDSVKISKSDLVFVHGLGFDEKIISITKATKVPYIVTSFGVRPIKTTQNEVDPHAWHDPRNANIYYKNIYHALTKLLPNEESFFSFNYNAKINEVNQIYKDYKSLRNKLRKPVFRVLTTHDAFSYLGNAYQITFEAPKSLSTEAEPSAKDVAKIVDQIRSNKIEKIVIENMSNPQILEMIMRETKAKSGGTLCADALTELNGPCPDYTMLLKYNIKKIVED